jgi:F-type H+-transporting ATPase subunit gamma
MNNCTLFLALLNYVEDKGAVSKIAESPSLLIACSSDRGLCGAIHSSVSKFVKKAVSENPSAQIVVLGDKSKPQIARGARKSIIMSFNQVGKDIPTFTDAIDITEQIIPKISASVDDKIPVPVVIFNEFKSVIAYETVAKSVPLAERLSMLPKFAAYECEPDTLQAYSHFLLASKIFSALVEGHASEMSAKRMAMENASKNSDEIVLALTMQYNRTRQAVITNELVDIITGASAL